MSRLYLVTGFLGAGKTTFLRQFLSLFRKNHALIPCLDKPFDAESILCEHPNEHLQLIGTDLPVQAHCHTLCGQITDERKIGRITILAFLENFQKLRGDMAKGRFQNGNIRALPLDQFPGMDKLLSAGAINLI